MTALPYVARGERWRLRHGAVPTILPAIVALLSSLLVPSAQQAQNPSPMVEHTRAHERIAESRPPGRREPLAIGTLFLPEGLKYAPGQRKSIPLLVVFHGGQWLPEVVAAEVKLALVNINVGAGSGVYAAAFADPSRFAALIHEAEAKAGVSFGPATLAAWSAGCGAIRALIGQPDSYARVQRIAAIDGIHAGYVGGEPGPAESSLERANLQPWLHAARAAISGDKRLLITHSEIFPGTFASTTETADYLVRELGLRRRPVLKWGPGGMQQLSEVRSGRLVILGFAGNSAPDHVDHLHALGAFLRMLR